MPDLVLKKTVSPELMRPVGAWVEVLVVVLDAVDVVSAMVVVDVVVGSALVVVTEVVTVVVPLGVDVGTAAVVVTEVVAVVVSIGMVVDTVVVIVTEVVLVAAPSSDTMTQ